MWERQPLEKEELHELLTVAIDHDPVHSFTTQVLAYTGMRASELSHLQEDWIDYQEELIRVPASSICLRSCCDNEWTPKTEAGARTIPVREDLIELNTDVWGSIRDVFKWRSNIRTSRQTIGNRIDRIESETDIKKPVTPHVLRHTYGTLLAERGASVEYIKQTMGHARLSSADTYIQYSGRRLSDEADRLFG